MKLYGITGFARSGKDTVAMHMVKEYGYTKLAFADPMREALYALNPIVNAIEDVVVRYFDNHTTIQPQIVEYRVQELVDRLGWDVAKTDYPEVRSLLQRTGTEMGRKVFAEDFWVKLLITKAKALGGNVVISDVRMEDECNAVRSVGGRVIRVNRPGVDSVNDHITDRRLPEAFVDFEVENDGTIEDLQHKIDAILATNVAFTQTQ